MRLIKNLGMGLLLLCAMNLSAQSKKQIFDTLQVNCNGKVMASLAAYDCGEFKTDTGFQKLITELQANIRKIEGNIPAEGNYRIVYQPGNSLLVEKMPAFSKFMVTGDSVTRYWLNNECRITTDKSAVIFHFNDYRDLLSADLFTCLLAGIDKIPSKSRQAHTYHYLFNGSTLTETADPSKNGHPYDMLALMGGTGLSFVKNQFVVDISAQIGFNFSKKGVMRNSFFVSDNLMYVFGDQSDKFAINNFLNLGYARNFSNDKDKFKWQGIEIGLPIQKQGELFKDNIFRLGIRVGVGGAAYLSTYLYVNEGFKTMYPGLRVSIPF